MGYETATIHPRLFYKDTRAAIDWLERAFGFRQLMAAPDEQGRIVHAELALGPLVIMAGDVGAGSMAQATTPRDSGGYTQSVYIAIDNDAVRSHYERAKAAGAEITRELETKDYGGSGYSARDLEGHEWSFGSYRPEIPA